MSNNEVAANIIAFACQCGYDANPHAAARQRGWIDATGAPTREGRALIETLKGQTRYGAYRLVG